MPYDHPGYITRREALRRLAGTYVQLPREGRLEPVAEQLIGRSEALSVTGDSLDLPDPEPMLGTLVQARPLLVQGRLLAADEPQTLLYLELLLSNWLIRNAEQISAEVLSACAEWPELRRYLLRPELLATRNLERLRNQLNTQQRWESWVNRPIQIYESRRPLFQLKAGSIACIDLTEPRDNELRQLGWWPQLITLLLESREAGFRHPPSDCVRGRSHSSQRYLVRPVEHGARHGLRAAGWPRLRTDAADPRHAGSTDLPYLGSSCRTHHPVFCRKLSRRHDDHSWA